MRVLILFALSAVTLAGCDSPYGVDYSKPDVSNYALSTGGHIKGVAGTSSVSTASGDALSPLINNSASGQIAGQGH